MYKEVGIEMTDGQPSIDHPALAAAPCSWSVSCLDWERTHDCLNSLVVSLGEKICLKLC